MKLFYEIFLVFLFILFIQLIQGQDLHLNSGKKIGNGDVLIDTSKQKNNNLSNFPFQIGIDFGTGKPNEFYQYGKWAVICYFDINIFKRAFFIELELGKTHLNHVNETSTYTSLGFKLNVIKFYNHRIIFHGGISAYSKINMFLPYPIVSAKYMYCINRLFGITASIKYPFGDIYCPLFTIGTQFYTN